ncbi:MAG TPA: universal stress protein [Bryobacteraceae bacterium]|nr:universal stress protein [Bryobacteraceae bacterium]
MTFRHILFPVDFSERSYSAAPYVKAMAAHYNASVSILHVVETPGWIAASDGAYIAEFDLPKIVEEVTAKLGIFAADCFPGIDVTQLVEDGEAGTCVADIAKTRGADLIMMPTHGRGTFRAALLGSVTAKVLHDAECAVWTGVHLDQPVPPQHTDVKTVMCALDLEPGSIGLIRHAANIAKDWDARVFLVHAVPGAETRPALYFDAPFENVLKERARAEIAKLQAETETNFEVCIEAGSVPGVVSQAARHHSGDLVLIGRGVINQFAGRLRSKVYGIIREAPCPVLSL